MTESPCEKTKISLNSFPRYWWLKNLAIWLDKRHNWPHPTRSTSLRCYLHLMSYHWSEISFDSLQRYWWSKNPGIWLGERHIWSHPTKSSSLRSSSKISIDYFQRYWPSNNTIILLFESILGHDWRADSFPDMLFLQNHKEHCYGPFLRVKKETHQWIKSSTKVK